jgi:hypothetical protein
MSKVEGLIKNLPSTWAMITIVFGAQILSLGSFFVLLSSASSTPVPG